MSRPALDYITVRLTLPAEEAAQLLDSLDGGEPSPSVKRIRASLRRALRPLNWLLRA